MKKNQIIIILQDIFKNVKIEWWARDEDDDTNGEGYYLQ